MIFGKTHFLSYNILRYSTKRWMNRHSYSHHAKCTVAQLLKQNLLTFENQRIQPEEELKENLTKVVNYFQAPIDVAVGYGSGVFRQAGYSQKENPMIDFIFQVEDPVKWHKINLQQNPSHYSFVKNFGPGFVSTLQESFGTGVYYNTHVEVEGNIIKYGVTSKKDVYEDLKNWNTMYLAGRFQKPVVILKGEDEFYKENSYNLSSALHVGLLMLADRFTEFDLYKTIVSLSYLGDIRMSFFAENPRKVENIVSKQIAFFRKLYLPLLYAEPGVHFIESSEVLKSMDPSDNSRYLSFHQNITKDSISRLLNGLPLNLVKILGLKPDTSSFEKCAELMLTNQISTRSLLISKSIKKLTSFSILTQSIKGIFTARCHSFLVYVYAKLKKGLLSKWGR
nr:LOW QUALITY PROTEIN: putative protein Tam41 [Schizosaccharomyces pombe]CAA20110.3 mitochondrial matrix protein import protein Tam41 (predicted) [Schizosaccharomyces pombe]|eukprot:NP_595808.3 LOW QUALITY PROTEIN: putative protein Tam41 [Schizosaccharomyces pombe]